MERERKERKRERKKEYGVMMLTTQARGTEFLAHYTQTLILPFCFHVSYFLFKYLFLAFYGFVVKRIWWLLFPFLKY